MRYINFLRSLAIGVTFLSIAYVGIAQPTFVIQNIKGSCEGLPNGSFEVLVTSGTGSISVSYFGPPTQLGIPATVGSPLLISNLPGLPFPGKSYIVVVQDEISSSSTNVNILNFPDPLSRSIDLMVNNGSCITPNGSIDITPSGGSGPPNYIFSWVGPSGFTSTTEDISGLAGGNYTLTLSDLNTNCSRVFPPLTITDPSPVIFNVTNPVTTPVCVGDNLILNLSGSEVGVQYEAIQNVNPSGIIQAGTGGALAFVIPSGTFVDGDNFIIRATNGFCTPADMDGLVVADIINLTFTSIVTNNTSCVAFNGAIDLTVAGSAGSFTYSWMGPNGFTANTEDISNLEQGTYTVEVTDVPSGCIEIANIIVGDNRPVLTLSSVVTDNTRCIAPFNGAINLTVAGSVGPFTFLWTGPNGFTANTEDITALEDGAYDVTVTDGPSGCVVVGNIVVGNASPTLALSSVVTDNSRCVAPFNGAINLTVAGSTGPFTFSWTGPSGFTAITEDIASLVDGVYDVLVTDTGSGCTAVASITVNNTAPTLLLTTVLTDNSRCVAPFNGAIDLTVAGSAGPFTFDWSGPGGPFTTEDIANLQDGVYTVIVTDVPSGCTATTNVTINNIIPTLTLTTVVTNNSRCVPPFNGAIDLTVAGSAGPFTFLWTGTGGPYATEDLVNLQPGVYDVLVTDIASGCTAITSAIVGNTTPTLTLTTATTDNSRCIAPFNGSIDLTVAGSAGPFTYSWSGPGGPYSTEDLVNLQDGNYSVLVTDVPSGCSAIANVTINNIAPTLTLTTASTNNSRCVAPFNGSINLTVAGSAGPFTFSWTGPGGPYATEDLTDLQDGVYTVIVTDVNSGCTATTNVNITNTAPTLSLSSVVTDNSRCIAPFNGAINLSVAGSAGPFTFDWTGPSGFTASTEDIAALEDGNYSVLVTDTNSGCTAVLNVSVGNTAPTLSLSSVVAPNDQCGTPTGSIDLSVAGSAGPFTFSWTGPSGFTASTEDISGLIGGNYTITVTDNASGCEVIAVINVPDITSTLTITSVVTDNTGCSPAFNGAINITVGGSAGPFTFLWTGPNGFTASTEDISALENGDYDVTVTETATSCATSVTITVGDNRPVLVLTTTSVDNNQCAAPFNGSIDLTVAGSAGPFTFAWTGPNGFVASTEDITALEPGTYDVSVTDNVSGCFEVASVIILNNAPTLALTSTAADNDRCIAPFNGSIDITIGGSVGPFTFSWTGPGGFTAATEDITNLADGLYTIVVNDVPSGCFISSDITVGDNTVLPTLTSIVVDNDRCSAPFNGAILITVIPAGSYSFNWIGPGGFTSTSEDISALASGVYQVDVVNNSTGCATLQSFTVGNNAPVITVTADAISNNSSCTAPFDGAILITAAPLGSYTFAWTGPNGFTSTSEDLTGLENGDYMVTATNTTLGCAASAVFTVGDNTPTISITSQTIVDNSNCQPPFNGSIDITAGGTPGPYTFSWTGPLGFTATGPSIVDVRSGDYTVTILDQTNGCSDVFVLTVGDLTPPVTVTLDSSTPNTSCQAPFTGSLSITASGTPGPFDYFWTGPNGFNSTDEDIAALVHGDYEVTVMDSGIGCQATVTFTVVDNTPPVLVSVDNITSNTNCIAPFDGAITVSGGGTTGPFDFSWTGPNGFIGAGATITSLEPGDYDVTVTDQVLGCQTVSTINVPNAAPVIAITQNIVPNSNCLAPFNGAIQLTSITGTPGGYDFSWTGPGGFTASTQDISNLDAGDYTVTITDQNIGCSNVFVLNVPQNATTVSVALVSATANDRCTGPFNGALDVTIGGTPGPFTISWTGPSGFTASTANISALVHGSYTVTVIDDLLGCTNVATFVVPNATIGCGGLNCFAYTITVVDALTQRPSCSNQNDGVITFDITGLTVGNYIIQLIGTSGTLTQVGPSGIYTFNGLSPDNYEYRIEDAVGNVCQQPYTLDVQVTVQATATDFVDASCFDQPTGQALFTVTSGGTSPFEYSIDGINWITFLSGQTITTLPPNGTYPVIIRDNPADQCPSTVIVTINNLNSEITAALTAAPATCNNNDGSITINTLPAGGDGGPYTFQFGLAGAEVPVVLPAGNVFSNLSAGTYNFIVTDNGGCSQVFARTVAFPGFVNTAPPVVNAPDCTSGGTNGSIILTLLDVGSYEFVITTDPSFVPALSDYTTTGGLTLVIPNLTNGDYFIWLRSLGSQCQTKLGPITVQGVFQTGFTASATDEICFGDGGAVSISNIFGAPALDYSYELVTGGVPATGTITFLEALDVYTITGLAPGSYQLRLIQDQTSISGCVVNTLFQSFTIVGPSAALGFQAVENIKESFPDLPTGSMLVVLQESGEVDYELKVELTTPVVPGQFIIRDFTVVTRNPGNLRMQAQYNNLYAGTYTLTVRDALGCIITQEIDIPVDTDIYIPNVFTPNGDGYNDTFAIRNLPTTGAKLIISNRWGNQVFSSNSYSNDTAWDGGNESDGIYYYRLQADGQVFTGWVEILRGVKP